MDETINRTANSTPHRTPDDTGQHGNGGTAPSVEQTITAAAALAATAPPDGRPALARAGAEVARLLGAVRPGDLAAATPCAELAVANLVGHLVFVADRLAAMAEGHAVAMDGQTDGGGEFDPVALETAAPAFEAGMARTNDAFSRRGLSDVQPLPWRPATVGEVVGIYVNELIVHGWDLATAVGATAQWSDEDVAVAAAQLRADVPDQDRAGYFGPMLEGTGWSAPFGEVTATMPGARPVEVLAALNGREVTAAR